MRLFRRWRKTKLSIIAGTLGLGAYNWDTIKELLCKLFCAQ